MAQRVYPILKRRSKAKLTMTPAIAESYTDPICCEGFASFQFRRDDMTIAVGDKLPDVKLVKATAEGPEAVQSADYFAGKRVALFSVPGAFTPTCSAKHLPGFVEKAADLKAKGIDEIACTAVNDPFVLGAWNKSGGSDDVTMLADGNGDFAEALGLTMDGSAFGLGKRGQRFSMVVNDGTVEQLHVEGPGEFKVSSADYMLEQL
jgi:peroxiredoxin